MNNNTPVYIKEVEIKGFKCFKEDHRFSFVDKKGEWCRWTVFLGNNNTGKTNLLKAIAAMEPKARKWEGDDIGVYFIDVPLSVSKKKLLSIFKLEMYLNSKDSLQLSYFQGEALSMSVPLPNPIFKNLLINGYGVVRNIERKGITSKEEKGLNADNLFNSSNLINFEDWLFQLDYAAKNEQTLAAQRRDLLIGVLKSEIFPEIKDIRFVSDKKLNNYIEYQTISGWYELSDLGYGYQATLSWLMDFCKRLFDRYPDSNNPLKEPAVLLVDEIDLHLHPQWQRSLIKYLSDIFTQTQFIVTTHSPFIIQSMENVNLYTLQRKDDRTQVKHWGCCSFIGWRIEEILSEIMGLGDNIQTDIYQQLRKEFDEALDKEDYRQAKTAYDKLTDIIHPSSVEWKLLDIQLSQIELEEDDKA
jgi:predicted ATP-binding protein involved in virulence